MSRIRKSSPRLALLFALSTAALVAACDGDGAAPEESSETHFLTSCDATCPGELSCLCGVCTLPCSADDACATFGPAAACISSAPRLAEGRCSSDESPQFCDATCLADQDCSTVGPGKICQSGYCRDVGAPTNVGTGPSCQAPALAPTELAVLGDVLIELSTFTTHLEESAVASGALATGSHFRDYASSQTSVLAAGPLSLEGQYVTGKTDGPMRVVVMDGGATDALTVPCGNQPTADCPALQAAAHGAESLLAAMAADGVEHVVYFFYPDTSANAPLKAGIDVLRPLVENACGKSSLPCHFLDLRPLFAGHPEYLTGVDGIVFSDAGAAAAASAIWALVQERCIAP